MVGILPPPVNGQSIAFKILCDGLKAAGIEFDIIDLAGSYRNKRKKISSLSRIKDYLDIIIRLLKSVSWRKSVIYIQTSQSCRGFYRDTIISRIAKLSGSKLISHLHGGNFDSFYISSSLRSQKRIKKELCNFDRLIVLAQSLVKMYDFEPLLHDKIRVVPNGIGHSLSITNNKHLTGEINILYLSNMIEAKGYLLVLDSLALLKTAGINANAKFCGAFQINSDATQYKSKLEAENAFRQKIANYGLTNEVQYEGIVTGDKKEKILEWAHCLVLPTSYKNEGQPISILEGMRYGCVTISSNFRAIPEMIENNVTGFLLKDNTAEEIASRVKFLVKNPQLFTEMSEKAIEKYDNKFTAERHVSSVLAIIKETALN